ncbi:MAG: hypothetical protein KDA54_17425, partial [Phycisphaerales bacterium]|nr:hypothetical protein [Phycisphaerales bacterium]
MARIPDKVQPRLDSTRLAHGCMSQTQAAADNSAATKGATKKEIRAPCAYLSQSRFANASPSAFT